MQKKTKQKKTSTKKKIASTSTNVPSAKKRVLKKRTSKDSDNTPKTPSRLRDLGYKVYNSPEEMYADWVMPEVKTHYVKSPDYSKWENTPERERHFKSDQYRIEIARIINNDIKDLTEELREKLTAEKLLHDYILNIYDNIHYIVRSMPAIEKVTNGAGNQSFLWRIRQARENTQKAVAKFIQDYDEFKDPKLIALWKKFEEDTKKWYDALHERIVR